MKSPLSFTKLHGLGNDFVLIDQVFGLAAKSKVNAQSKQGSFGAEAIGLTKTQIQKLSNRKTGVGFDQLLVLRASKKADFKLLIFNADGSKAEMCGNGLRACAFYFFEHIKKSATRVSIETEVGVLQAREISKHQIETEMGVPETSFQPLQFVPIRKRKTLAYTVDVGNPHLVVFFWPNSQEELTELGSKFESHKAFPKKTNVQFVQVLNQKRIEVQVWERGVGITQACGSGAVAAAVACLQKELVKSPVTVSFPGGSAIVRWSGENTKALLTGSAYEVFSGSVLI